MGTEHKTRNFHCFKSIISYRYQICQMLRLAPAPLSPRFYTSLCYPLRVPTCCELGTEAFNRQHSNADHLNITKAAFLGWGLLSAARGRSYRTSWRAPVMVHTAHAVR